MFGNSVFIGSIILLATLFFYKLLTKFVAFLYLCIAKKTKTEYDEAILYAFRGPFEYFLLITGIYIGILVGYPHFENMLLQHIYRSLIILLIARGFYAFSNSVQKIISHFKIDPLLSPFLTRIFRFLIFCFALILICNEWNFNMSGFLEGLGLGGLAFALAAKDSLANLFAGIVIVTEKPFSIGDWIQLSNAEGTVEDITFRSTKIRTFTQALVVVPNAQISNEAITNWTKMGKRQISFQLGLSYRTTKIQIERVVSQIQSLLQSHTETHDETILVNFDNFGSSSLDILVYFFTKTTNWSEYLKVKEDINLKILDIVEREQIDIAFPSTSVYFETPLSIQDNKKPKS